MFWGAGMTVTKEESKAKRRRDKVIPSKSPLKNPRGCEGAKRLTQGGAGHPLLETQRV